MINKSSRTMKMVALSVVIMFVSAFLTQGFVNAATNDESIMGSQVATAEQMSKYALSKNSSPKINCTMLELAEMFLEEGAIEGVRGDIAFAQACKETGYFAYGGSALPEWNNYSGLGVTGVDYNPDDCTENQFANGVTVIKDSNGDSVGVKFSEPRLGVRAQIQHLKGYATSEPLKQASVDPRYSLISKGIAPDWVDLNGRWAVPGTNYGQEILALYTLIEQTANSVVHPTSVSLNKTAYTLTIGGTDTLTATVMPSGASNKTVTWKSSAPSVATVSSTGVVKGIASGSANIIVTTTDGGYTDTCAVTVKASPTGGNLAYGKLPTSSYSVANISRLTDGNKDANIYYGTTTGKQWVQLDLGTNYNLNDIKLWHYFGDARKYHDVIVQLSNDSTFKTNVTTVFNNDTDNSAGLGLSAGTDTEYAETTTGKDISFGSVNARYVRLYSNGSTANAWNHYVEVEVYDSGVPAAIHPTSVSLNKTTDTIAIGATDKITPIFTPSDTTNKNVTWSSSDATIALVSTDGTVTGVKTGTATITVKTEDGGFTATCKVNVGVNIGNLAAGKIPASSYSVANISRLTDGNKDPYTYYGTTTGKQWVQLDLGTSYNLNDIKLWHYFGDTRKYHDVIVQISNDSSFKTGVTTVFNNDADNSAGLGLVAGADSEYAETISGKDITFGSVNARYVRLYSNGSTANAWNHYVEVEVYGSDVPAAIHPTSVSLNKTTDTLTVGGTDTLTATVMPAGASNKNVTWTSSAPGVATVSSTGLATAVSAGTATITAKTVDGNLTATCIVTVKSAATVSNLAAGKLPTAISTAFEDLSLATDGIKSSANYADSGNGSGLQWVQVDLANSYSISSIKLWHYFGDARKYNDVVVQLSNDPKFISGVTTVYNNDTDDSAGLGKGTNSEYNETSAGLNITFSTVNARYARFYTNGSNINEYNHYCEIEIYGK